MHSHHTRPAQTCRSSVDGIEVSGCTSRTLSCQYNTNRHITCDNKEHEDDHTMVVRNIHPSEASIAFVIVDPLVRDKVAPLIGRKFNACSFVRYIPGLRRTEPPETENAGDRAKSSLRSFPPKSTIRLSDDTLESVLVPLDGLLLVDLVGSADLALAPPALGNTLTRAGHADVEVHTVDTAPVSQCFPLSLRIQIPHTQCWGRT